MAWARDRRGTASTASAVRSRALRFSSSPGRRAGSSLLMSIAPRRMRPSSRLDGVWAARTTSHPHAASASTRSAPASR